MTTANYLIIVGVDGSEGAHSALRWAVREARERSGSVQAVHAWRWEFHELRANDTGDRLIKLSDDMLKGELEKLPPHEVAGVAVACESVEGTASAVLTEAARVADLLVLGSHGHSRQLHQVLGSVTEDCIRHATCPVVIIPASVQIGEIDEQSVAGGGRASAGGAVDLQHPAVAMGSAA